jgi:hypothetical protein
MKNKQVKKLRSYAERYKIILGALIMVGALLAVSSTQLQTGFIASENGFTVPFVDGEGILGLNSTFDLVWSQNGSLADSGFTSYEILITVNAQGFVSVLNQSVSGDSVVYTLNAGDYNDKDVVIIRMQLYQPYMNTSNETVYDIYWDDVTIQIFADPSIVQPTTTVTTPTGYTPPPNQPTSGEDVLIILMFGIGIFLSIMVVGMMIGRRRK